MPFQIFVSYARNDDLPPLDGEGKGFITTLLKHLEFHFTGFGEPVPVIWRDRRAIARSEQFDPIIEKGINDSQLLLVVLSNNWVHREFCLRELDLFHQRWRAEGDDGVKRRIIVVGKNHIEPSARPALLQGQEGYLFYAPDDENPSRFREFFVRGKAREEYHERTQELAEDIWHRACEHEQVPQRVSTAATWKPVVQSGRKVYLAKPAADMRAPYARLVDELGQRGYALAPSPDAEFPADATAKDFVLEALEGAELSIHLLGDKGGWAPEDCEPIVPLQLKAAAEAHSRRVVWAPRILVDEHSQSTGAERDPFAILEKFDHKLDSDTVDGSELSAFAQFVVQHLDKNTPPMPEIDAIDANARVYLYHRPEDTAYATAIGRALAERGIQPVFPAFEGDPAELAALHRQELAECDAVVLCWANAAEVWVKSQARELKNWRDLGRDKQFACRGLVAGPPPGQRKELLMQLPPRNEIDVVLDLTGSETPAPDALDPLIRATRHPKDAA
ncbi:MAG TPA: toll/interleukin-1 receptor domain-containing protein [Candidatus Acidoferrales bacterium]|nr:toll/interleukin-1 receptor domain-containing protein [Candidatus Acidoferrales bacterium]